jgi:toxin YoeB
MQIVYTPIAKEHLDYWVKSGNKAVLNKIMQITKGIIENPYKGIGKPEPLKYELTGYWSRRITKEHRYVYAIAENILIVASLKGHYIK